MMTKHAAPFSRLVAILEDVCNCGVFLFWKHKMETTIFLDMSKRHQVCKHVGLYNLYWTVMDGGGNAT